MLKKRFAAICLSSCCMLISVTACSNNTKDAYDITSFQDATARKEFNTELDLNRSLETPEAIPDDFFWCGEAEDAKCTGQVAVMNVEFPGYSGQSYVGNFTSPEDQVIFEVEIPVSGVYDLTFQTCAGFAETAKQNPAIVNGTSVGTIVTEMGTSFSQSSVAGIYLEAGVNEIAAGTEWGYYFVDQLTVTPGNPISADVYQVTAALSNPNASDHAKRLYQFLLDCYGKYTITGQYCDSGKFGKEMTLIHDQTGEYPAMLGLDMIDYTPSRVEFGGTGKAVDYAIDFYCNKGGIITMCWHWNAPKPYLINNAEHPWYSGFYTEHCTLDLDAIAEGTDTVGKELLLSDIDAVAEAMKPLQEADVPVLWRPLHEASGGWFWWGNCKPESYLWLWNQIYAAFTNKHGLNNLIWVWNGQDKAWYPGDDTVDIIGMDLYPPTHTYTSQSSTFAELTTWSNENKLIALTENGCMPDPDLLVRDHAMWSWFCTWGGEYIHEQYRASERYTEFSMWKKVYQSEHTLSLDDLPCLWEYPLQ